MPPKARGTSAKAPGASTSTAAAKKRARQASQSSTSGDEGDGAHNLFLVAFSQVETEKHNMLLTGPWRIAESFSPSITHLVINSMSKIKSSQQLLPIYYAVLKDIPLLKPSFLPCSAVRRKSLGGLKALEDEKDHTYNGKEIDAGAQGKSNFPSILDIIRLRTLIEELKEEGKTFFGAAPFQKVSILAGRSNASKQRRDELKMVMEAGGATVADDTVFKTWKAKRKKGGDIEKPSMIVIVNGEANVSAVGLDDETMRDLLKARTPIFYEEYIAGLLTFSQPVTFNDDLLNHSFAFIHDHMKSVDPDNKLQKLVMNEDDDDGLTSGDQTPAGRRQNSRASSGARESSSSEQIGKEKKKGRREKAKEEELKEDKEEEQEKEVSPKQKKEAKKDEKSPTEVKKGRGRPKKSEKKAGDGETAEEPKKEVKRGRAKTDEVKKEEKKEVRERKDEEDMEAHDVDPALTDSNLDLEAEFEREIEEWNKGKRRQARTEEEMEELRAMREDRGDDEMMEDGEPPVTPEPIIFSQIATQPEIVIPEELRRALEGSKEGDGEGEDPAIGKDEDDEEDAASQKSLPSSGRLIIDEDASDDGSTTIVGENNDDIADMERLREDMNNERRGGKRDEDEYDEDEDRSATPMGDQPASEFGMKSVAPIVIDDAKECETCNHLGTQHLYINQQAVEDIVDHFSSPRLDWFDHIIEVRESMPWIKRGGVMRPACGLETRPMIRSTIDLFFSFYHELQEEGRHSALLEEINSSDAMEMYEADWEAHKSRRPPLDLMIKMLHEFSVKRHSEDLLVPERACAALKNALPVILPSSSYGRHFWLTVLSGGSNGIKGRATQVMEEMARRCKTFFTKALINGFYHAAVVDFIVYFCEVDLLCAQTPLVDYEGGEEEESMGSQTRKRKGPKSRKKKNPLDDFPLVLLLMMEMDEEPRRGLSESALLTLQRLLELTVDLRRNSEWSIAAIIERALLCLLEAARWHCAKAVSSALTGAERRRVKAAESASQGTVAAAAAAQAGPKCTTELQQNVQRFVKLSLKKGVKMDEVRDTLTLAWLEDIVNSM